MADYLTGLDEQQLFRLERRVWDRMTRPFGYQRYGFDAPTLRAVSPGLFAALLAIRGERVRRVA